MKAPTAREMIAMEFGKSKNFMTPHVIKVGKIDRETAYEISSGEGFKLRGCDRDAPWIYAVTIVRWHEHDNTTTRHGSELGGTFESYALALAHVEQMKEDARD